MLTLKAHNSNPSPIIKTYSQKAAHLLLRFTELQLPFLNSLINSKSEGSFERRYSFGFIKKPNATPRSTNTIPTAFNHWPGESDNKNEIMYYRIANAFLGILGTIFIGYGLFGIFRLFVNR